jgi:hypothetical protein
MEDSKYIRSWQLTLALRGASTSREDCEFCSSNPLPRRPKLVDVVFIGYPIDWKGSCFPNVGKSSTTNVLASIPGKTKVFLDADNV